MHKSSIASPLEATLFSVVVEDHVGSCIEVTRDQSIIRNGEEAGDFRGVGGLAGNGWRDIDVDDLEHNSVHINHDGLVLQIWILLGNSWLSSSSL